MFALLIYRDRLTMPQALGIAISLIGVAAIISRGEPARLLAFSFNEGDLWVLAAILAYALYTVLLKSRPTIHPLSLLLVTVGLGALLLVPATAYEVIVAGESVPFDGVTIATGLYIAIGPSLLAYFCFNRGVQLIGANRAGPFMHLVPPFGSLFAIVFLGEAVHWYHGTGWLLILVGIAVTQRPPRRTPPQ
jgi:drug/metabolite transporter (DMT)-like permease